jgi:tripartite-type tricarboxylate transporter receptor subunit TctC
MTRQLVAGLFAAIALCGTAWGQDYPTKPVRLLIPFPTGGLSDTLARAWTARVSESLGQPIVIDNRPGAGTTIAAELVAKSTPDGYTLFLQDIAAHAINAAIYRKLPYDSIKDFTQIALVASSPLILVVRSDFPAKSLRQLIDMAKTSPGKYTFASPGNGTLPHLVTEALKKQEGLDLVHVPYKGGTAVALMSGQVHLNFSVMPPAVPQVKAGKFAALAVTAPKRVSAAPDVPTMAEAGVPNFEFLVYSGIMAPAGVPRGIVSRLNADSGKAVASPAMQKTLASIGAEAVDVSPEQFTSHLASEITRFDRLVKESGAKLD